MTSPNRPFSQRFAAAAAIVWMFTVTPLAGAAQDTPPVQVPLNLAEAIQLALAKNLTLLVEALTPRLTATDEVAERAVFDPSLFASTLLTRSQTSLRALSFNLAGAEVRTSTQVVTLGVQTKVVTGASVQVTLDETRLKDTSRPALTRFNPATTVNATLQFTQPLLKNFGLEFNRSRIFIARFNRDISAERLRETVQQVVTDVQTAYWDLVFRREDERVKETALDLARDLLRRNRIQVEAGVLAPIEITQAEAEVASREAELVIARREVEDAEDGLLRLVNLEEYLRGARVELVPTDRPQVGEEPVSLDESLQAALTHRPELARLRLDLASKQISVSQAQNQVLPAVDLTGLARDKGLGGNLSEGFDELFSGARGSRTKARFDAQVGLSVSFPLGNRAARAALTKAEIAVRQARLSIRNQEQQILVEIRQAVRRLQTDLLRIAATRKARELAEQKLDNEEKKFRVGLSTNRNVLEIQRDLTASRGEEIRAVTDYTKSRALLERAEGTVFERHQIQL